MPANQGFNPFMFSPAQPIAQPGVQAKPAPVAANGQPLAPGTNGLPAAPNPGAGTGTVDNNGTPVTTGGGAAATGTGTGSPLDAFTDFFKIDPNKKPAANPLDEKLFNLDPKKLGEAAAKLDFARSIKPELMQKALAGDVASFQMILNQAMQAGFMMQAQMNINMMEGGFARNNERFSSALDGRFRDYQVNTSVTQNPALKHPAIQPVLAAIRSQIATQNPNMPPSEVASKAEEYFMATHAAISTLNNDQARTSGTGPKEADFSLLLGLDGSGQQQQ